MQSQQRLTPQSGRPRKLYSYVLDHDEGRAPHVSGGLCTLAKCKDRSPGSNRGNIVENARVGDWIIGTGGLGKRSAGHGKLIYAMRVTKRLTLADYRQKYPNRRDSDPDDVNKTDRFVLLSDHFFYFGRNARDIPTELRAAGIEKRGRRYRCDFDEQLIGAFEKWLNDHYERGVHGPSCASAQTSEGEPVLRRCCP